MEGRCSWGSEVGLINLRKIRRLWKLGSHSSTDITSFSDDVEKSQAGKMDRLAEVE